MGRMVKARKQTAVMEDIVEDIVAGLETAWNDGDGAAFASYCAEDADFVNVYGMHGLGRPAIAKAHDTILRTIYAGSLMAYSVKSVRMLAEDVALMHIDAQLWVPQGPLEGQRKALPSMVVTRQGDEWRIASFHNTFVAAPPPMHNNGQAPN
jgi:uncharacterized protein (TIGR02246 family)